MDSSHPSLKDAGPVALSAVAERQAALKGTVKLLSEYDPALIPALHLKMSALESLLGKMTRDLSGLEEEAAALANQAEAIWLREAFAPWSRAVSEGTERHLTAIERNEFELGFMNRIEREGGRVTQAALFRLALWSPSAPAKAEALAQYMAHRGRIRNDWLKENATPAQMAWFERLNRLEDEADAKWDHAAKLEERKDQLRRVYFLKRQIGAAAVLGTFREAKALSELVGLQECEASPFIR